MRYYYTFFAANSILYTFRYIFLCILRLYDVRLRSRRFESPHNRYLHFTRSINGVLFPQVLGTSRLVASKQSHICYPRLALPINYICTFHNTVVSYSRR